jgi:hypothetical protein
MDVFYWIVIFLCHNYSVDSILNPTSVIPSKQELGYTLTNNTRMGYAEPEWIVGKTGPVILLLDDYSRKNK